MASNVDTSEQSSLFKDGFEMYMPESLQYMKEKESLYHPGHCLKNQIFITANKRGLLVKWMTKLCQKNDLRQDTLFIAVNYLDRFLKAVNVAQDCFKLVGMTCLVIAGKLEECTMPSVDKFLSYCGRFNVQQMKRLEVIILRYIDFHLSPPIAPYFLEYIAHIHYNELKDKTIAITRLANKVLIKTLPVYRFTEIKASILAAAAFEYAKITHGYQSNIANSYNCVSGTSYAISSALECFRNHIKSVKM